MLNLVQLLGVQNQQLQSALQHEREMRQQEIAALRREMADAEEKIGSRLRLELSEKLRQLPRGE